MWKLSDKIMGITIALINAIPYELIAMPFILLWQKARQLRNRL